MDDFYLNDLAGENYLLVLTRLHRVLRPRRYFEIGTREGNSLRIAAGHCVAVDPEFALNADVLKGKASCLMFQTTSDAFFDEQDVSSLLGGKIDLAFLDGMHLFEYLLRDFINTEKHCRPNSVIAIHDCIPVELSIARRNELDFVPSQIPRHQQWWAGDVWKVIPVLLHFRPDLKVYCFDASPTGLVLITGLDPNSQVLASNYFKILEEYGTIELGGYGLKKYIDQIKLRSTSELSDHEKISRLFWL
jgi:hypothetical protein